MDYEPDYERIIADQQVLIRTLWATLEELCDGLERLEKEYIIKEALLIPKAREIVAGTKRHALDMAVCACGHLMRDHDTNGCLYLGCKPICGPDPSA